jgi:hypothetical protein
MKNIRSVITVIIALVTTSANAVPTLFFDGNITYDVGSGLVSVTSQLTATEEIAPVPNLIGSGLVFSASLNTVITPSSFTLGLFSGVPGDDILVMDGDSNTLLSGDFINLQMLGSNGNDSGSVTGTLSATGGNLISEFGTSNLIALQFNLDTLFAPDMFTNSFSGHIDGRILGETQTVPEPAALTLLGLGLVFIGLMRLAAPYNKNMAA